MEASEGYSKLPIGTLARYTFVPAHPIGSCTQQHLQNLLKLQQQLHKAVQYYILISIRNIDKEYDLLLNPTQPMTQYDQGETTDILFQPTSILRNYMYGLIDHNNGPLIYAFYTTADP